MNKYLKKIALIPVLMGAASSWASTEQRRVIEFRVEKINEATHWVPEKVTVKPGENITIKAQYNLTGGFDFHGFSIPELKIDKKVDRNKTLTLDVTIPSKDVKELSVNCQFHPKHVGAKIKVE